MNRNRRLFTWVTLTLFLLVAGAAIDRGILFFNAKATSPGFFARRLHSLSYSPDGNYVCVVTEHYPGITGIRSVNVYTFSLEYLGGRGKGRGRPVSGQALVIDNDSLVLGSLNFRWSETRLEVTEVEESGSFFKARMSVTEEGGMMWEWPRAMVQKEGQSGPCD